MKVGHDEANATQFPIDGDFYGAYDPVTAELQVTVEASSDDEAKRRIAAVAPIVGVAGGEDLVVICLDSAPHCAPLFMAGYFEAKNLERADFPHPKSSHFH